VQRVPVGFRINGYSFNAQFAAGANDAYGDLPTVCNQNFFEHDYTSNGQQSAFSSAHG
jgi:hypothetical protein